MPLKMATTYCNDRELKPGTDISVFQLIGIVRFHVFCQDHSRNPFDLIVYKIAFEEATGEDLRHELQFEARRNVFTRHWDFFRLP